jgi:hypothetical protein
MLCVLCYIPRYSRVSLLYHAYKGDDMVIAFKPSLCLCKGAMATAIKITLLPAAGHYRQFFPAVSGGAQHQWNLKSSKPVVS